jgi:hypothetical protein
VILTRVLRTVPLDTIDGRSQVGVALRRLREELARQLGGDVTPAQAILIEEIAKKAIIVRAVGEFIMRQDSLVQGNRLLEVVTQHDRLSATLGSLIDRLGLERKTKEVRDLATYLAEKGDGSEKGEKVEKGADVVKGGGE